jgi:hypothetical protein
MKILIPLSLLIAGIAIGYVVGINSDKIEKEKEFAIESTPSVQEVIHDTIIETKIIEIETEKLVSPPIDSLVIDSLIQNMLVVDTLVEVVREIINDSIGDEELNILSDVRLKLMKLPIKHLNVKVIESDSLLKSAIDITDIENKNINIEFWESPINFSGYKLSKSKLIIYGLSPQFDYQLFKSHKTYYLKFHSIIYELIETEEFKKFIQTSNSIE